MNRAGNMEPGKVYPDYPAPIRSQTVRMDSGACEGAVGDATPPKFLKGKADSGVDQHPQRDIAALARWLGLESRCVVPATSFSEYGKVRDPETKRLPLHWFALSGGCTAIRLCGPMDAMARGAQGQGG